MSNVFDVRTDENFEVDKIVFSNEENVSGYIQADNIVPDKAVCGISISDADCNVNVYGKEHALNLIKALEKAIELKWLV